jgi:hypothetical protein
MCWMARSLPSASFTFAFFFFSHTRPLLCQRHKDKSPTMTFLQVSELGHRCIWYYACSANTDSVTESFLRAELSYSGRPRAFCPRSR